MTNRPVCPKGQRKDGSPCIFCEDGSYCAHQYYCPATRRYENTGWRECGKREGRITPLSQALPDSSPTRGEPDAAPFMGEVAAAQAADERGVPGANDPPKAAGPTKEQEVTPSGTKKSNRRKPRKG